ncbi:bridging integrator 3-like [Actinia tenebrosa]|uniref:Bridging integrator 3-like n=1 Tax=Actinia tenebrosa TaxID=6105 RepID=A0A6P8I657_ACTTE|nr:bridging integrator 3-like [Actinia tenebrosa]
MSWINPFNKLKGRPAGKLTTDNDFERQVARFNEMENATKKVYKGMKKYDEAVTALGKAEQKIYQDLAANLIAQTDPLKEQVDDHVTATAKLDELRQLLVSRNKNTVVEPLKRFNHAFPRVNEAIKSREQSLIEYAKQQAKAEKLTEKEKQPQNPTKIEQAKQDLAKAKADFERQNATMLEELPLLIEGRIAYFEPSFEALIRSEASYYNDAVQVLTELTNRYNKSREPLSVDQQEKQLEQKLADLKALSITEDE